MLLGVDVGGTFTDAVLVGDDLRIHRAKVRSTPEDQSLGVLEAVRLLLAGRARSPREVRRFAHGMTVATNALLEGRTARTALIATAGFTDVIELGRQARPRLYELSRALPRRLSSLHCALRRRSVAGRMARWWHSSRRQRGRWSRVWPAQSRLRWRWHCCTHTPTRAMSACWEIC